MRVIIVRLLELILSYFFRSILVSSKINAKSPAITPSGNSKENNGSNSELYMSSKQWLKRHGLKGKKLGLYDFLQTLAFKHCDGVVDLKHAPTSKGSTDAVSRICDIPSLSCFIVLGALQWYVTFSVTLKGLFCFIFYAFLGDLATVIKTKEKAI